MQSIVELRSFASFQKNWIYAPAKILFIFEISSVIVKQTLLRDSTYFAGTKLYIAKVY